MNYHSHMGLNLFKLYPMHEPTTLIKLKPVQHVLCEGLFLSSKPCQLYRNTVNFEG